ncbi:MAG: twin-arginine translocase TatA/TatE family subunit [Solirubrobacteraceae bacterium]
MGLDNPIHLALLVVVLLLLFGAKRIPEIGRSLGGGLREFKQSINGDSPTQSHDQQQPTLHAGAPPPPAPAQTPEQAQSPFAQRDPAATDQR